MRTLTLSFLLTAGPAYAQTLEISGVCPGPITMRADGLLPDAQVALLHSATEGSDLIGYPYCPDIDSGLDGISRAPLQVTDAAGELWLTFSASAAVCDRYVRVFSLAECDVSNVDVIGDEPGTDADGDGWDSARDCNDLDASVHPEAVEVCDGVDNDCSGTIDLGVCPCDVEILDGHPYQICTEGLPWEEARDACEDSGYHLATIDQDRENRSLARALEDYGDHETYWIGYNDVAVDGDWVWEDGSPSRFEYWNWATGEPNGGTGENCAMMYVQFYDWHGRWNDESCTSGKRYVCEYGG